MIKKSSNFKNVKLLIAFATEECQNFFSTEVMFEYEIVIVFLGFYSMNASQFYWPIKSRQNLESPGELTRPADNTLDVSIPKTCTHRESPFENALLD